ncbi:MAG: hypothetical protein Q9M37_09195 [Desulfonauticus sp.]|nr:hypothetical protein [Desulfonauticus sp.]
MAFLTVEIIEELERLDPVVRSAFIKILKQIEKHMAETVTREDFRELKQTVAELSINVRELNKSVAELTEAQKRSEQRISKLEKAVAELAETQKKTEQRLNELAEAQKKTEQRLNELIGDHKKTREQLGGLSHTVGYILEDRAYVGLPILLEKDLNIKIITPFKRDFIEISPGKYIEVNIIAKGTKNGKEVYIIGEAKAQLKKRDNDLLPK